MSEPTPEPADAPPAINDQLTPAKPEQAPAPTDATPPTPVATGGKSCKSKQKHGGKKTRKLTEWQLLVRRVMNENKHKKNYKFGDALKEAKTLYRKKGGFVNKSTNKSTNKLTVAKSLKNTSNKHTKRTK